MRIKVLLIASTFLAIAGVAIYYSATLNEERALADARKQLPFISLSSRIPKGNPIRPAKTLAAEVQMFWEEMEKRHAGNIRTEMLQALHERTRNVFVERPGAGKGRMLQTPKQILMNSDRGYIDQPQPGKPANFPLSPSEQISRVQPDTDIRDLHKWNVMAFFLSKNFGYVKDRQHVAGFKPHGFRIVPRPPNRLRVDHVLLLGILTQERPVVYLTEALPTMEQARLSKTRSLDVVEEAGMSLLREGEDLYVVRKGDTLRMIGALRATRTCLKCHDAEVGDLLGAFSYTLRPDLNDNNEKLEAESGIP